MIEFDVTVQEGCIPEGIRPDLEAALRTICGEVFGAGGRPVTFSWSEIPRGNGFRGGEPSTTTMLRGVIPDGCDQATGERFLMNIGEAWYRIAEVDEHDLVASARDRSWRP